MNSDKRQLAGVPVLAALTGLLVMVVFAGPASAGHTKDHKGKAESSSPSRTSGGCVAVNGSVCSGESFARDDSTASGASTAIDDSVASGGLPDRDKDGKKPDGKKPEGKKPTGGGTGGGDVPTAGPAEARRVGSLAFTGPSVGPELAMATGLLLAGALLLGLGSERRRSVPSS